MEPEPVSAREMNDKRRRTTESAAEGTSENKGAAVNERKPANYWVDAGRTGKDQKARVLHEPQFFTRRAKREQRSSSQNAELENIPIKPT